jgi:hypothetical protein
MILIAGLSGLSNNPSWAHILNAMSEKRTIQKRRRKEKSYRIISVLSEPPLPSKQTTKTK